MAHTGSGLIDEGLEVPDGVCLVVQGGAMRGAFALGALAEIAENGHSSRFDLCIGSSSGAISLAYFLADQAQPVSGRYWEHLASSNLLRPSRFWRILDIDYLIDSVVFGEVPIDTDRLRANPTKLLVGLTDARYRLPTYILANDLDDAELREVLRASAALPGLYNRRVKFRGKRYIDGSFVDPFPILRLWMLGCRRIVAIATSPLEYSITLDSMPRRLAIKTLAIGQGRLVRQWIGTPNPLHDINLEALIAAEDDPGRLAFSLLHHRGPCRI